MSFQLKILGVIQFILFLMRKPPMEYVFHGQHEYANSQTKGLFMILLVNSNQQYLLCRDFNKNLARKLLIFLSTLVKCLINSNLENFAQFYSL